MLYTLESYLYKFGIFILARTTITSELVQLDNV